MNEQFDEALLIGTRFVAAHFDWNEGRVSLRFEGDGQETSELVGEGSMLLRLPREQRWTENAKVYWLRRKTVGMRQRIEVELQGGDILELEADRIGLSQSAEPSTRR